MNGSVGGCLCGWMGGLFNWRTDGKGDGRTDRQIPRTQAEHN